MVLLNNSIYFFNIFSITCTGLMIWNGFLEKVIFFLNNNHYLFNNKPDLITSFSLRKLSCQNYIANIGI